MKSQNSSPRYSLSPERASAVVNLLADAMKTRAGLAGEQDDLVENQIPSGVADGSLEHAQFLFMVVPNDRGVKSSALWSRAKAVYLSHPELFDPVYVHSHLFGEMERLSTLLAQTIKPRYVNHAVKAWVENAVRIINEFEGDPRNLFSSSDDAREVYQLIRSYRGFGPKTGGMMLRAAMGLGWASSRHIEKVEIPVDVHDVRISIQTDIISITEIPSDDLNVINYPSLAPKVRRFLTEACAQEGVSWPEIDRALWLIGSRGCVRRRCLDCPISSVCSVPVQLNLFGHD